jgi:lipopolysaccharide assembly outer membrane protein LptD (OstA)
MIQITEFSLQNGGYYFALSDHYDLTVLGDYYTNGSYGML